MHYIIKITETEEGMKRALDGGFSYIDNYYFIKTLVSTFYTDDTGYTPAHISSTHYPLFVGNAWAFRYLNLSTYLSVCLLCLTVCTLLQHKTSVNHESIIIA